MAVAEGSETVVDLVFAKYAALPLEAQDKVYGYCVWELLQKNSCIGIADTCVNFFCMSEPFVFSIEHPCNDGRFVYQDKLCFLLYISAGHHRAIF